MVTPERVFVGDHEVKNTGLHQRMNVGFSVVYEITYPLQAAALRLSALAPASVYQQHLKIEVISFSGLSGVG